MPKKPDFATMKPRIVEAYIREKIKEYFGNTIENESTVTSDHGYYDVNIKTNGETAYRFENFRKKDTERILRALRFLAGGGEI